MVPERSESVSKTGARIMLEECLHHKLEVKQLVPPAIKFQVGREANQAAVSVLIMYRSLDTFVQKLAGQPVPKQMILALTQERDKILVSSMRAFIPTHRKPCLGGGFNPRSHKACHRRRMQSQRTPNTILNSSPTACAPLPESLATQSREANLPSELSNASSAANRCKSSQVPAYIIQDPSYLAAASALDTSSATSPPGSAPPICRAPRTSIIRPASHHTATNRIRQPLSVTMEDSFIKQDTSLSPELSAHFASASPTCCADASAPPARSPHPTPRPRTATTPITFPSVDASTRPSHSSNGRLSSTQPAGMPARRPATALPATPRQFSPSPCRILSAHNGCTNLRPRRQRSHASSVGNGGITHTSVELTVKRVDPGPTRAAATSPRRKTRPATTVTHTPRQTYVPPLADAPGAREQQCHSAAACLRSRMHERHASPPRQIHSAPARGRIDEAQGIAAARVSVHAVACGPEDEGILPSYTLRFALGMVQRVEAAAVEAHSARACSACASTLPAASSASASCMAPCRGFSGAQSAVCM